MVERHVYKEEEKCAHPLFLSCTKSHSYNNDLFKYIKVIPYIYFALEKKKNESD